VACQLLLGHEWELRNALLMVSRDFWLIQMIHKCSWPVLWNGFVTPRYFSNVQMLPAVGSNFRSVCEEWLAKPSKFIKMQFGYSQVETGSPCLEASLPNSRWSIQSMMNKMINTVVRSSPSRWFLLILSVLLIGMIPLRAAAPVKITFWHYVSAPQPSKELEAQIAAFNASQSKYVVESPSGGTYQDLNIKLVAALRANNAPSMAMVDNVFFTKLAQGNQLADLSGVLEIPAAVQSDLVPVAWNYGQINKQRLGLPWATSSLLLFYNTGALQGKGIGPPKTWQEFANAAKKLTARGSKGAVFVVWVATSLMPTAFPILMVQRR
jgi:maltose-binding protein MalE